MPPNKTGRRGKRRQTGVKRAAGRQQSAVSLFQSLKQARDSIVKSFGKLVKEKFDGIPDLEYTTEHRPGTRDPLGCEVIFKVTTPIVSHTVGVQNFSRAYTSDWVKQYLGNDNISPEERIDKINCITEQISPKFISINKDTGYTISALQHTHFSAGFKRNFLDENSPEINEIRFESSESFRITAKTTEGADRRVCIAFGPIVDCLYYKHTDVYPSKPDQAFTMEFLIFPVDYGPTITSEIVPHATTTEPRATMATTSVAFSKDAVWTTPGDNTDYCNSIDRAFKEAPIQAINKIQPSETENKTPSTINNRPHITASYLSACFPRRRRVSITQFDDTSLDADTALRHAQRVIADTTRLHVTTLMMAEVAIVLRKAIRGANAGNLPEETKKEFNKKKASAGGIDAAEDIVKCITDSCMHYATAICNDRGWTEEMHKLIVSTTILSDYVGILYDTLYELHKLSKTDPKESENLKKEMISQLNMIYDGRNCMESEQFNPKFFGHMFLVKCMNKHRVAVQPKSKAEWPRAARGLAPKSNDEAKKPDTAIDGETIIASIRDVQMDIVSKSNEGHQWPMIVLYEIRTEFFLSLDDLVPAPKIQAGEKEGKEQIQNSGFAWWNTHNFFTDKTNAKLYPPEQRHFISIRPNNTTKLHITINLPLKPGARQHTEIFKLTNTYPSIPTT
jgi:hypothetical protein